MREEDCGGGDWSGMSRRLGSVHEGSVDGKIREELDEVAPIKSLSGRENASKLVRCVQAGQSTVKREMVSIVRSFAGGVAQRLLFRLPCPTMLEHFSRTFRTPLVKLTMKNSPFSVCTVSVEYFQRQTSGCMSCAQVDAPSLVIKCGLGDKSGGGARILVCLPAQGIIIRPALSSAHTCAVANEPNTVLSRHVSLEESSKLR